MPLITSLVRVGLPSGNSKWGNAAVPFRLKLAPNEACPLIFSQLLDRVESLYVDCTQNSAGVQFDFDTQRRLVVPPGAEGCYRTFSNDADCTVTNLGSSPYILSGMAFACAKPVFERFPGGGLLQRGGVVQPTGQLAQTSAYVNPGPARNTSFATFDRESAQGSSGEYVLFSPDFYTATLHHDDGDNFATSTIAYGINPMGSGRIYFEVTKPAGGINNGYEATIGVISAQLAASINPVTQAKINDPVAGAVYMQSTGNIYYNGQNAVNGDTWYGGGVETIGVAVDLTDRLIWFRVNGGAWNANPACDPALGTAGVGVSFARLAGPFLFAVTTGSGSAPLAYSVNNGQQAFQTEQPDGYTPGWPGTN